MSARWRPLLLLGAATVLLAAGWFLVTSGTPDGLESQAEKLGFARREAPAMRAPLAGYEAPWFRSAAARRAAGGLAGVVLCFLAAWAIGRHSARRAGREPLESMSRGSDPETRRDPKFASRSARPLE